MWPSFYPLIWFSIVLLLLSKWKKSKYYIISSGLIFIFPFTDIYVSDILFDNYCKKSAGLKKITEGKIENIHIKIPSRGCNEFCLTALFGYGVEEVFVNVTSPDSRYLTSTPGLYSYKLKEGGNLDKCKIKNDKNYYINSINMECVSETKISEIKTTHYVMENEIIKEKIYLKTYFVNKFYISMDEKNYALFTRISTRPGFFLNSIFENSESKACPNPRHRTPLHIDLMKSVFGNQRVGA